MKFFCLTYFFPCHFQQSSNIKALHVETTPVQRGRGDARVRQNVTNNSGRISMPKPRLFLETQHIESSGLFTWLMKNQLIVSHIEYLYLSLSRTIIQQHPTDYPPGAAGGVRRRIASAIRCLFPAGVAGGWSKSVLSYVLPTWCALSGPKVAQERVPDVQRVADLRSYTSSSTRGFCQASTPRIIRTTPELIIHTYNNRR